MPMKSPMDFFLHELSDINSGEKMTLKTLALLENETRDPQLKLLIRHHIQETRGQISRLEDCFKLLGAKPSSTTCYAIEGLTKEKQHFAEESPSPELVEMFNQGAIAKTEHYEIAVYRGLVDKAGMLGQKQVGHLLHQTLLEEETMAQKVEEMGRRIGSDLIQPRKKAA